MYNKNIPTVIRAVRLPYAVLFVVLLAALYLSVIHPWMKTWGSTSDEQQMPLPGDELYPPGAVLSTMAVSIDAPPAVIWQWLVQVGQDKAGFYTYAWLENILGADIHNLNEIHLEWQTLRVGDAWRLLPANYLGGVGEFATDPVLLVDPGRALGLAMFGTYVIMPTDADSSRLLLRGQSTSSSLVEKLLWDPIVFIMGRRMLLGLAARAEGRPDAPAALMLLAHVSWVVAAFTMTLLFIRLKRRALWLLLPVMAALPALLAAGDVQAALAAFLAFGIPLLGFLYFGKYWGGPILIIAPLVLLTLILAPEAWTAFGLIFAAILLTAAAVAVRQARITNRSAGRLAATTR